jgi:hypothetical protein
MMLTIHLIGSEDESEWSYASTLPYVSRTWCLIKRRHSFIFIEMCRSVAISRFTNLNGELRRLMGIELKLHAFHTLTLDSDDWSSSLQIVLIPWAEPSLPRGAKSGSYSCSEEGRIFHCRKLNLRRPRTESALTVDHPKSKIFNTPSRHVALRFVTLLYSL